jgi:hypothetical protein
MSDYQAFFHPFPLAPVKVHVSSADASSLKFHKHFSARNFWLRDFLDFDVMWSSVNSCFQKKSTSDNSSSKSEVLSLLPVL